MHATLATAPAATPPRRDGRHRRKDRSRADLLQAARAMLATGDFRPSMAAVAKAAGYSVRTPFALFGSHDALLSAALDGPSIRRAILALILRDSLPPASLADQERLVRAAVFGRV